MFVVFSKNSILTSGGFVDKFKYFSAGNIFLYFKGKVFVKVLKRFRSPYFSLIGNLGSSKRSFVSSMTPECWPKAYLKFNSLIILLNSKLYSPKG